MVEPCETCHIKRSMNRGEVTAHIGGFPYSYGFVVRSGSQLIAIARPRNVRYPFSMAFESTDDLAGVGVPELD